ncbi:DNA-binding CsgD family transcriptional regulator [Sphingomonas sp. F9_3S_D5_B_2]
MRNADKKPLTEAQIECLHLVAQNLTSKEIALRLGISPHTVDQRVRRALRRLGATDRRQAARLMLDHTRNLPSNSRPEQALQLADRNDVATHGRRALFDFGELPLPYATAARPHNTLTVWQRLLWIFAICITTMIASSMYLAGLESLSRLLRD